MVRSGPPISRMNFEAPRLRSEPYAPALAEISAQDGDFAAIGG